VSYGSCPRCLAHRLGTRRSGAPCSIRIDHTDIEFELELIQSHMAQKPVLRGDVGARVRVIRAYDQRDERGGMDTTFKSVNKLGIFKTTRRSFSFKSVLSYCLSSPVRRSLVTETVHSVR